MSQDNYYEQERRSSRHSSQGGRSGGSHPSSQREEERASSGERRPQTRRPKKKRRSAGRTAGLVLLYVTAVIGISILLACVGWVCAEDVLALNKEYPERLAVLNSGSIDEYVRVRVYRYWMKEENGTKRKVTTLAPSLIDLNFVNEDHWIVRPFDTEEGERECVAPYYKGILPAGSMTELFADTIRIDGSLSSAAKVEVNGSTITTTYQYDGVEFHVDVEVDAVQTHNARDAIRSAWGIDASALGILQEDVE